MKPRSPIAARSAAVAIAVLLWACGPAWAASPAEGRSQARKAGQLAARGKCAPAVEAYTRAFQILRDPAILFNRGECLRKLDRLQAALADYERFLAELPNPPNKALVEERISSLQQRLGMPTDQAANATAPNAKAASVVIIDDEEEEEETVVAPPVAVHTWSPPGEAEGADLSAGANDSGHEKPGVSPWVWGGLAAVVVAAAVAGVLVWRNENTEIPESELGNYKF